MDKITEKTLIPIASLWVLLGGVFTLALVYASLKIEIQEARSDAASALLIVGETKQIQKDYTDSVQSIDRRLSRMEGHMGLKGEENVRFRPTTRSTKESD